MASSVGEILSLQLGHYANYVGTHWWNIQDSGFVYNPKDLRYPKEINNDILFREGENLLGEVTYTPRLVAVDLKGSLNTLRQEGVLYDIQGVEENLQWSSDVTLHKFDTVQKNTFLRSLDNDEQEDVVEESVELEKEVDKDEESEDTDTNPEASKTPKEEQIFGPKYYNLDEEVSVWSDMLRLHLHPKSVTVVEKYRHGWEGEPFDVFGYGQEVYQNRDLKLDVENRVHFFLEECDSLQGIHLLADTHDGFGGLAAALMEELSDDYSNKSMLIYSVSPPQFPNDSISRECHRAVNSLLSYDKLLSHSCSLIPISLTSNLWRRTGPPRKFSYLNYKSDLSYHSSALLAASLDTMTIPYRLETGATLMSHLTDSLTTLGRKVLSLHSTFPVALRQQESFIDYLQDQGDAPPWQSLTPHCSSAHSPSMQSVVIRGISDANVKGSQSAKTTNSPVDKCKTIEDVMQLYLTDVFKTQLNAISSIKQPLPTVTPFPHVFNEAINDAGELSDKARPSKQGVAEVPMMTSLQCNRDTRNHLNSLYKVCQKFNIKKFHRFLDSGLEEDAYIETLENFTSLIKCYGDSSSSDEEDDDV